MHQVNNRNRVIDRLLLSSQTQITTDLQKKHKCTLCEHFYKGFELSLQFFSANCMHVAKYSNI